MSCLCRIVDGLLGPLMVCHEGGINQMQIYMKDGKALKINGGGYLAPKASGET